MAGAIPWEELEVGEQIAGGGFAVVHRGSWRGTPVAVKRYFSPALDEEAQAALRQEALTLQGLAHPHVLQYLGASLKPPNLAIVTELMPHSLHSVLYGGVVPAAALDRRRVLQLATDVARAFVYLHGRKPPVVHRDIKPSNFLVDRAWRVKVADFGTASSTKAGVGTPAYMAPELLQGGKAFSSKVDCFGFGVLLAEMLSRSPPWPGLSPGDIKREVLAGRRPNLLDLSLPKGLTELVTACWAQEPESRPGFGEILQRLEEQTRQLGSPPAAKS